MEELAYLSSAVRPLTDPELEALLAKARERNERLGVTGVLLYHDGDFFQYLGGPPVALDEVFGHIRRSPQHRSIITLVRRPISERRFSNWTMGFVKLPKSELLQLSNADWSSALSEMPEAPQESAGIKLLRHYWAQYRATRWN